MEIPADLRAAIDKRAEGARKALIHDAESISLKYRTQGGQGRALVSTANEAAAYAVARMPATYGAVLGALGHALSIVNKKPKTLLDAGAGTGSASWACSTLLDLESVVCLEREKAMRQLGQELMKDSSLANATWIACDITKDKMPATADLVVASYVLNEMGEREQEAGIAKLWSSSKEMLLIVEPGTPAGYSVVAKARELLLKAGGHILAPCPHEGKCPISGSDWCHFAARIPRSRLHREAKGADAPYEDEKYSYVAFSKTPCARAEARITRHPFFEKGLVSLNLCGRSGLEKRIAKKKDEQYKQARKAKWGDPFF
ncbi:MAG: small ribosomal subunit Rsm22 family protein [Clostridiales bacterium]|jgi:ribosomal protein RSM22 (predicted rRNA methylase)|nr:small ribosomal subunit Rsm22 family protein [Clostridiales bacterium]